MREIAAADLRAGDHVEMGEEGYEVRDVDRRRGRVEVVDTGGSVHIYAAVAVVAVRRPGGRGPATGPGP